MSRSDPKILLIQLKRLGDVLMATPALELLRKRFPKAQIHFAVYKDFKNVLDNNPNVDKISVYPAYALGVPAFLNSIRKERYDWVFDFLADGASAWITFASGAKNRVSFANNYPSFIYNVKVPWPQKAQYSVVAKIEMLSPILSQSKREGTDADFQKLGTDTAAVPLVSVPGKSASVPNLYVNPAKIQAWKDVFENAGYLTPSSKLFFLSPSSRRSTRRWPAEKFTQLANSLISEWPESHVLCLWGPGERDYVLDIVNLAQNPQVKILPRLKTIHDLASALKLGDCLITNCNGAKHVAVAMGVPTVTIHMSSDPRVWNMPDDDRFPVIRADHLWCIGCQKNACPFHLECASWVGVDQVLKTVASLIKNNEKTLANA